MLENQQKIESAKITCKINKAEHAQELDTWRADKWPKAPKTK